jgi:hypothetical protein
MPTRQDPAPTPRATPAQAAVVEAVAQGNTTYPQIAAWCEAKGFGFAVAHALSAAVASGKLVRRGTRRSFVYTLGRVRF